MRREISQTLYAAGDIVATEAQISITRGAVSGKNHVPSAPGEAPNADTHTLANGIQVTQPAPLKVLVVSTAPYSMALEKGTSGMAARPFMGPAADASRREVNELVSKAARRAIRRHMRD